MIGVCALTVLMWTGCGNISPGFIGGKQPINQVGNVMITMHTAPKCRHIRTIEFFKSFDRSCVVFIRSGNTRNWAAKNYYFKSKNDVSRTIVTTIVIH